VINGEVMPVCHPHADLPITFRVLGRGRTKWKIYEAYRSNFEEILNDILIFLKSVALQALTNLGPAEQLAGMTF
jgi:hypothetical protein